VTQQHPQHRPWQGPMAWGSSSWWSCLCAEVIFQPSSESPGCRWGRSGTAGASIYHSLGAQITIWVLRTRLQPHQQLLEIPIRVLKYRSLARTSVRRRKQPAVPVPGAGLHAEAAPGHPAPSPPSPGATFIFTSIRLFC